MFSGAPRLHMTTTSPIINGHSFCSPSRVKLLPIPICRIKKSRFSSFVGRLELARIVKLGDVTPDSRPDKARFNPQSFPAGQVVYDFVDSIRDELSYLEDFQIYRRVFVIAGIADGKELPTIEDLQDSLIKMNALYPRALIQRIFVFEATEELISPIPDIVCILPSRSSQLSVMRTVMSDVTSTLLSEFSLLGQTVQSLPTLDSPNVLFDPADQALQKRSSATGSVDKGHSRTFSQTVHGNQNMSDTFKKRGKGRVTKTSGDLYLLAGRTADALKEYAEAANFAKHSNDYLWHGAALEGLAICLVVLAYLQIDVPIPVIAFHKPLSNDQTSNSKSLPQSQWDTPSPPLITPQLHDLIPQIYETIFYLYDRSHTQENDTIPLSCSIESHLRLISLYCVEYQTGGWTGEALKAAVLGTLISEVSPRNIPPRVQIANLLAKTHQNITTDLDLSDRIRYLSILASSYSQISFYRRRSLIIRQIVLNLIPGFIQSRIVGAADRGVHPASNEITLHSFPQNFNTLLEEMCSVYTSDPYPDFGWPSLKSLILKDCIAICEALPNYEGAVDFSMRFLGCASNPADQLKFMGNIPKLLSVSKGAGKRIYWDGGVLISVNAQLANMDNMPTLRRREELVKDKDLFIFNPHRNTIRKDRDMPAC
ncbi:Transport protein particle subunit trs120 [Neolecta irregularis DAH-3]|uniref:Transport protein particle subunit trs120 n=1 Tax=Neolecta irregularis (strain DAH-3) TaxID=1198029 RepID=A0A1U7LJM6_NEOID|nr:Transport protein particle subunit trs120 [Neolecta irregularis DAH-3]|eukprot:OLL22752.1 Transport protein particle subunit trs120 [Neolecta irregularis DAH-3]